MAKDGRRLADLYGHLPGYWIHPNLVVATFEKNITRWSGELGSIYIGIFAFSGPHNDASGQPTSDVVKVRGIMATKKLKAGATFCLQNIDSMLLLQQLSSRNSCIPKIVPIKHRDLRQNDCPNSQSRRIIFSGAAASIWGMARLEVYARTCDNLSLFLFSLQRDVFAECELEHGLYVRHTSLATKF